MNIKFFDKADQRYPTIELEWSHAPSIGDHIYIYKYLDGVVTKVYWYTPYKKGGIQLNNPDIIVTYEALKE